MIYISDQLMKNNPGRYVKMYFARGENSK